MIQLSSKALIKSLNVGIGKADVNTKDNLSYEPCLEEFDHDNSTDNDDSGLFTDEGNDNRELKMISEEEQSSILDDMSAVQDTVLKVSCLLFLFYLTLILTTYSFTNFHLQLFIQPSLLS